MGPGPKTNIQQKIKRKNKQKHTWKAIPKIQSKQKGEAIPTIKKKKQIKNGKGKHIEKQKEKKSLKTIKDKEKKKEYKGVRKGDSLTFPDMARNSYKAGQA